MSPVLISSLRRPPTPATFKSTPSDDADMHLRQRAGGDSSDDDTDYDDMPSLESVAGSDEEEAPPSTQPPPRHPNYANMLPTIEEARHREWTMDQFVCFLYRDSAVRVSFYPFIVWYSHRLDLVACQRRHGGYRGRFRYSLRRSSVYDALPRG